MIAILDDTESGNGVRYLIESKNVRAQATMSEQVKLFRWQFTSFLNGIFNITQL